MKDDKYDQLMRMMRLLKMLETSDRTIANLALENGISPRTVARYMDAFRSLGFCIGRNRLNEYTLLNTYGVPHLKLTKCEVESLIITCTECYSQHLKVPSLTVETALFKIAESTNPEMVFFLKKTLHHSDDEVISNMFCQIDTHLTSNSARCL